MNLLKNLTKRLQIWTTNRLFRLYFRKYYYPFESADDRYMRMKKDEKLLYLMSISHFVDSDAYKIEFEGMIRDFYERLCTKTVSDVEASAYRMTLIFIIDFQNRLQQRADKFKQIT